jgi:apolipoprotein N-acyltransferase
VRQIQILADAVVVQWGWRRLLLAAAAGALSALAFAPVYAIPVLWLTLPVLVWLIDGAEAAAGTGRLARLRPAAAAGWAFGFGFFLAGLWWIGAAFLVDAPAFGWMLPVAVIALPAALACFWAVAAAVARALWLEGAPRVLVFAAVFAVAEYARGHLFTGFPWNAIGYAAMPVPLLMQSAALVGLWGVTLAAFVVFAVPAVLADHRAGRRRRQILALAAVLVAGHLGYGTWRMVADPPPPATGLAVRIVQPTIPQNARWDASQTESVMARYLDLARTPAAPSAPPYGLLVLPESAFPFYLTEQPDALGAIADLLPPGAALVAGAARREPGGSAAGAPPAVFNSIYVIDDRGEIRGAYDKVHLVPFGEYLPWRSLFDAMGIRQLVELPGGFTAGTRARTLRLPDGPAFAPLICYEIIFPGAVVDHNDRPSFLLNVTNDGWYASTPGPYQHFLQARVRAVEEGLPLVRAANSGISAVVDASGGVVASLGLDAVGVVDALLPSARPPTLYGRIGDLGFAGGLILVFLGAILSQIYRRFDE